jgi:hypothetical protein
MSNESAWPRRDASCRPSDLPSVENRCDHREPFHPTEDSDLEPSPGHYKDMLGLPF